MRFMVIEHYRAGAPAVYRRAAATGRMLPEGVRYLDSWVVDDEGLDRCFQLMETDDPALLEQWCRRWEDLVGFEVLPVVTSSEAAARAGVAWPEGGTATS